MTVPRLRMPRRHLYDFERTARDGPRVLCGRDTRDVKWVGYSGETRGTICGACLRVQKRRAALDSSAGWGR